MGGCLYDVYADPTEHENLSGDPAHSATFAAMQRRLAELAPTKFEPVRKGGSKSLAKEVAHGRYGGYWGPFVFP